MGQYFILANVTKKEWLSPWKIGGVSKEAEWLGRQADMLIILMACGDTDGGAVRGRWAGDHVILAGDYDPDTRYELPLKKSPYTEEYTKANKTERGRVRTNLYHYAKERFEEISAEAMEDFNDYVGAKTFPLGAGDLNIHPDMVMSAEGIDRENDYPKGTSKRAQN